MLILFTALFGVFILSSLFAFFISTRPWPWFVRATILIISTLPYLLVEAGDFMLILLTLQSVVFLAVQFEKSRQSRFVQLDDEDSDRLFFVPKFRLVDLLLTLVIACAVSALLSQTTRFGFLELIGLVGMGIAIGTWSLVSIGLVYWKFPWHKKTGLCFAALTLSLIGAALSDQWLYFGSGIKTFFALSLFLLTIAAFVLIMLLLYRFFMSSMVSPEVTTLRWRCRKLISRLSAGVALVFGLCFLAATLICFVTLLRPPELHQSPQMTTPEEPNGFIELSEAAQVFFNSPYLSTSVLINPCQKLRDEIEAYSKTFDKIDTGLARKTRISIDLSTIDPSNDLTADFKLLNQIQNMRGIARALSVKARQEIHDGNYDEAIDDGLRSIKTGQCLNDCTLVSHLVAIACEGIGSAPIQRSIEHATTEKLMDASQTLREVDAATVPLEQVFDNDEFYFWQSNNWKLRLFYSAQQTQLGSPESAQLVQASGRRDSIRAQLRTAIALELYKREHSSFPDNLANLVPDYLDEVPDDPFSRDSPRRPLVYIRNSDGTYSLYSVSVNGLDEQGKLQGNYYQDGDLNFAEIIRLEEIENRQEAAGYASMLEDEPSTDQK